MLTSSPTFHDIGVLFYLDGEAAQQYLAPPTLQVPVKLQLSLSGAPATLYASQRFDGLVLTSSASLTSSVIVDVQIQTINATHPTELFSVAFSSASLTQGF